jgi:hypothetical protein
MIHSGNIYLERFNMLFPHELAYDTYKFADVVSHMMIGINTRDLPDVENYSKDANFKAKHFCSMLREASDMGINLGEVLLAQIKELTDAGKTKDTRRTGGPTPTSGV